jgi:ABC-type dipeptide/oligopeptide/nickel transport system permease component
MGSFILRRLLAAIPVIVGVVTLVFLLVHFIPGDPVEMMLGDSAAVADKVHLRHMLGLDLPLPQQYLLFWKNIFNGTWGTSIAFSRPVLSLILDRFGATLLLSVTSLVIGILLSFPLGVNAARHAGSKTDTFSVGFSLLGMSVPIYVVAPIAILIFSVNLRVFPVAGYGTLAHLALPTLCLGFGLSGILTRMVRTSMLECLGEDYVRTARSKGLAERDVLFKHALRNAMIPVITIMGNMLGGLLAGAVITETLFDWPGIGKLFFSAFQSRDYPLVQGVVLWIAVSYVLINLLVDILYSLVDPRVRFDS